MCGSKHNPEKFSLRQRMKSFLHAFHGLRILWKEEPNARIHVVIAILVIPAGLFFKISPTEWIVVILATGMVLAAEILNTSIENLADFVSPVKNEKIRKVKDLAAAGVLVTAISALVTGVIIFLPKIIVLLGFESVS
jgi:diacylglycerol kinase